MRNGAWTTLSAVALLTSFGELARAKARRGERAALALTGVADLFAEEGSLARSWIDYSGLHKQGGPRLGLVQAISWPRLLQAVEGRQGSERVLWTRGARTHLQLKDIQDLLVSPLGASTAQREGHLRYLHLSLQEAARTASDLVFPLVVHGGVRLAPHVEGWTEDRATAQRVARAPRTGQISRASDVNWTKTLRAMLLETMGRRGEAPEGLHLFGKVST